MQLPHNPWLTAYRQITSNNTREVEARRDMMGSEKYYDAICGKWYIPKNILITKNNTASIFERIG